MQVEHKAVRYLRLRVRHDGQTRVSAPLRVSQAEVRAFLDERADWIQRQQQRLAATPRSAGFALADGECLPFAGGPLTLCVSEGRPACWREADTLQLRVPAAHDVAARRECLLGWYRAQLAEVLEQRMPHWAAHMGLALPEWHIRNMATRWGSCNPTRGRINIALRLMAQPSACLDYVIVHELAHLRVAGHNPAFWETVAGAMPEWRSAHDHLRTGSGEPGLWR
ncbi:M48 family metallopeptidase [Algiphilus aromaticivorans]|uniref:M48 family metallopeptidase n=1 Tax=Algiphilus aromaticivorans TaxID=382454 RepID=UPI0005C1C021|nr:SprT family zinc-dependent metalloprotease [Algiphilus aromaticivorans]